MSQVLNRKWLLKAPLLKFEEIRDSLDLIVMDTSSASADVLHGIRKIDSVADLSSMEKKLEREQVYLGWFNESVLPYVEATAEVCDEVYGYYHSLSRTYERLFRSIPINKQSQNDLNVLADFNAVCSELELQLYEMFITKREYIHNSTIGPLSSTDVGLATLALESAASEEQVSIITRDRDIIEAVVLMMEFMDEEEKHFIDGNLCVHYSGNKPDTDFREVSPITYCSENLNRLRDVYSYGAID